MQGESCRKERQSDALCLPSALHICLDCGGVETTADRVRVEFAKFAVSTNNTAENTADAAISSDSCLFKLFAFLYFTAHKDSREKKKLKDHAQALALNEDDFNRNWLFVYEALPQSDLKGEWKPMKKAGVSFIKMSASKDTT